MKSLLRDNVDIDLFVWTLTWTLKVYDVEYFVRRVIGANDTNVRDWTRLKCKRLPRLQALVLLVDYQLPVYLIHRRFNVEAVSSLVAVPQENSKRADEVRLTQLHENVAASELMTCISAVPVIVCRVAIQKRVLIA